MTTKRKSLKITILNSLWNTLIDYAEKNNTKVSYLFENYAEKLMNDIPPLKISPYRKRRIYHKESEFQTSLQSLYIKKSIINYYKQYYGEHVSQNSIVQTVFYYFCKENELSINERYFDDNYFADTYTYQNEKIIEKIQEIADRVGRSPSIEEYEKYRLIVDAPSLQTISKLFGSFNNAKKEAGLEVYNYHEKGMFSIDDSDFHAKFLIMKNRGRKKVNKDHILKEVDFKITENIITQLLNILSEREKKVIINRLGMFGGRTKSTYEIADEINTHPSYVTKIEKRALKKLFNELQRTNN